MARIPKVHDDEIRLSKGRFLKRILVEGIYSE